MITVVVDAWLLAVAVPAGAQGAREEPRIALIIGNSASRAAGRAAQKPGGHRRSMPRTRLLPENNARQGLANGDDAVPGARRLQKR